MGRSSVTLAAALALVALLACKKKAPPETSAPSPAPEVPAAPAPAAPSAAPAEKPAAEVKTFSGTWTTAWGRLTLTQTGGAISGDYAGQFTGKVAGSVEGNVATLTWTQTNGETGKCKFTLAADGESFTGTWGSGASTANGGPWNGKRKK